MVAGARAHSRQVSGRRRRAAVGERREDNHRRRLDHGENVIRARDAEITACFESPAHSVDDRRTRALGEARVETEAMIAEP